MKIVNPLTSKKGQKAMEILDLMDSPNEKDRELIEKAYDFAENAHKNHKRYSGEPYFTHLFETAKGLAELGMGSETIAAGLLHDTIEDSDASEEEISNEFGSEILFLVEGVTKLGTLRYQGVKRHNESLRKLFAATSQDIRVLIIKLMDRLHNMKTLDHVPEHKRKRIAQETLEIYVPITDRLGMGKLKREFEDLAFPYVYPKEYAEAQEMFTERTKNLEQKLNKILKTLRRGLAERGTREFRTEYRIKGLYSFHQKLRRKEGDEGKIHDILALRVIVPTIADCYTVFGIVHELWKPLPGKIKDYIALPKPNGYRSLHTTVVTTDGIVEFQIRTEEMNRAAKYGIASHLVYKTELPGRRGIRQIQFHNEWIKQFLPGLLKRSSSETVKPASPLKKQDERRLKQVPEWIKEIAAAPQAESDSEEKFLDNLKADFFSHRIFVFTPKGDVIDLSIDSSPIDFAYTIHSDIGNHIFGVKVNGKLVSLDTPLKNGDIVEILTRPASHPTQRWLEIAKTTAARKHIRTALQAVEDSKPKR